MIIGPGEPDGRTGAEARGKRKGEKAKAKKKKRLRGVADAVPEAPHAADATTRDEASPAGPAPAAVGPAAPADATPDVETSPAGPAPVPSGPTVPAGAVVDRIDDLRARVGTLLAIADGWESPRSRAGASPAGPGDPADAPVDPLTRPVEPIPAAIAAALTGRPARDVAPGHESTPGVADPPGGPTTTPSESDSPSGPPSVPSAAGHAPRASASAVLVARELLARGMAPEGVRARLQEAYGVADPDAALASAR
jgi:hypothetical protein